MFLLQARRQSLKSNEANIAEKQTKYCFPCQKVVLGGLIVQSKCILALISLTCNMELNFGLNAVVSAWLRACPMLILMIFGKFPHTYQFKVPNFIFSPNELKSRFGACGNRIKALLNNFIKLQEYFLVKTLLGLISKINICEVK